MLEETAVVLTVKLVEVWPAATTTLAGTPAALELLESETEAPPVGAAVFKVTVPVEDAPPVTLVGLTLTVESVTVGGGGGAVPAGVTVMLRVPAPVVNTREPSDELVTVLVVVFPALVTATLYDVLGCRSHNRCWVCAVVVTA